MGLRLIKQRVEGQTATAVPALPAVGAVGRTGLDEADLLNPLRGHEVGRDLHAGLEHVVAVQRHVHRQHLVAVAGGEDVGEPSAPAGAIGGVSPRGLPQHGLVGVREQLRGARSTGLLVEGLAHGSHQRAHVGDDGCAPGVEHLLGAAHLRMQAELAAAQGRHRGVQGQQLILRDGQLAAARRVNAVVGIAGHDHVEAVVAAVEVDAHQRAVVVAEQLGHGRLRQLQLAQHRTEGRTGGRGAQRAVEEFASIVPAHLTSPPRTRARSGSATGHPARARAADRCCCCPCHSSG